jgi:hypothetical protein
LTSYLPISKLGPAAVIRVALYHSDLVGSLAKYQNPKQLRFYWAKAGCLHVPTGFISSALVAWLRVAGLAGQALRCRQYSLAERSHQPAGIIFIQPRDGKSMYHRPQT